jgi:phosphohistidine phosphatase
MIYLMRHADAVSDEQDPARPLSKRGREQVARVCATLLKAKGFEPAEIWHSPLTRARETAELLAEGLRLECQVVLKAGLEPDDPPAAIAAALEAQKRSIAVVGHEPHLGVLAGLMVQGPRRTGIYFPFPKAAVMALTREGAAWSAEWLVSTP